MSEMSLLIPPTPKGELWRSFILFEIIFLTVSEFRFFEKVKVL